MKFLSTYSIKFTIQLLVLVVFFGLCQESNAQNSNLRYASKYALAGNFDSAWYFMDKAIANNEGVDEPVTWYLKSFILKELYKAKEKNDPRSTYRKLAVEAGQKALEFNVDFPERLSTVRTLKYLAARYRTDAAIILNTGQGDVGDAIYCFEEYKGIIQIFDSTANFKDDDFEFYITLGDRCVAIFEENMKENKAYFIKAEDAFKKVLSLKNGSVDANFKLGRLYYNRATSLLMETSLDIELVVFEQIQAESASLFQKALPFMRKAYTLQENNLSVLEALSGIHYAIGERDKSDEFRAKKKALEKDLNNDN